VVLSDVSYEIQAQAERLEPPQADFALKLDTGLQVGLEITEATRPEVKRHYTLVSRLSDAIEEQMNASSITGCVSLSFSHPLETPPQLRAAAQRTATAIVAWIRAQSGMAAAIAQQENNDGGAYWAETFGLPGLSRVELIPDSSAWVMPGRSYDGDDRGCVIRALRRKEERLLSYKAALSCDWHWLLVLSGGHFADPSWDTISDYSGFSSSFDRVFFLERRTSVVRLQELSTKRLS
jgi:hypothetical protein